MKSKIVALTDIETSGDVPSIHEILEIGLVVFDINTFKILDTLSEKAKPENIQTAIKEAIDYNGYNEKDWKDAKKLEEVMKIYQQKTEGCIFCAYNVSFDWGFINEAFYRSKLSNPMSTKANHDRLDLLTLAWYKGLKDTESFSLKNACKFFGVEPEPEPHSALNGAMTGYNLMRKMLNT